MSIVCTKIEDSTESFVRARIDPSTTDKFPFCSDYEFSSCVLRENYVKIADRIQNFKVRPDDVWVCSFPKSGTTWMQNIVYQLKNNMEMSSNFVPCVHGFIEKIIFSLCDEHFFNELDEWPSPRIIKSHLPAYLLPREIWTVKPKLIYTYRNPKDVAISFYHMEHNYTTFNFPGSLEEYLDAFLNDQINYTPYHANVNSYMQLQRLDHLITISYEELSADIVGSIKRINKFLNCSYSHEQLERLAEYVSFEKMRTKEKFPFFKQTFNFFRKGKVGGFRDEMSQKYIERFDEWEKKHSNSDGVKR